MWRCVLKLLFVWDWNDSIQFAFWDSTLPNGSLPTWRPFTLGTFKWDESHFILRVLFYTFFFAICSGFAAGIYTTNTAEACLHCAINGQADIIVVEDRKQLEKILAIKDQIPTLKAIIQYSGKPHVEGVITVSSPFFIFNFNSSWTPLALFLLCYFNCLYPTLTQWSQLMNLGNSTPDNVLEERLKKQCVNQCCTLIYTVHARAFGNKSWSNNTFFWLFFCFYSLERLVIRKASCSITTT